MSSNECITGVGGATAFLIVVGSMVVDVMVDATKAIVVEELRFCSTSSTTSVFLAIGGGGGGGFSLVIKLDWLMVGKILAVTSGVGSTWLDNELLVVEKGIRVEKMGRLIGLLKIIDGRGGIRSTLGSTCDELELNQIFDDKSTSSVGGSIEIEYSGSRKEMETLVSPILIDEGGCCLRLLRFCSIRMRQSGLLPVELTGTVDVGVVVVVMTSVDVEGSGLID